MYGESVFTSMRMINGVVQDWDHHFERMRRGVEFVYGPFTDGDEWVPIFKNRLEARFQDLDGDRVIRLTVYREQSRGLMRLGLISVTDLRSHVSCTVFDHKRVEDKMLRLRTCPAIRKPSWWPSYLKAGNYLETILGQKIYLKPGDDDLLFLSADDTVLESSVANIFVVKNDKLYTAPTGPNVLEGIMRKKVLEVASAIFSEVLEEESTLEQVIKADAVFGSNSIRGLFLVDHIDDYEIVYSEAFLDKFLRLKARVMQ
jgi:branched-subunit amino acid aminotransferase/4-amino-4-deoxychorismate lyase